MKIGIRTVKTAVGAGISIWIAMLLHLNFYVSAGILTILCIERTRMRSIQATVKRLVACILGLAVGAICFTILGYHAVAFTVYLLIVIPLLNRLKMQEALIFSSVIALHLFILKSVTVAILWNEFQVIFIGIGVALIINSYIPDLKPAVLKYRDQVEEYIKKILFEYASYLDKGDQGWLGTELLQLDESLNQARMTARADIENQLGKKEEDYYFYFEMRQQQYEIIKRILPIISTLSEDVPQRHMFASFLYYLSENVSSYNKTEESLEQLHELHENMKKLDLPTTRIEFETRANLYHLMNEMELYLTTKSKYYQQKIKNIG
ncbi:aromatic acid exporter family protein [Ectobacillus polymachus]|uniref:aromatic acid exporter family protein n=1 Tax=Ectobacillus polymachus TaxID=1508806 RepID=UPI003A854A5B